MRARSDTCGGLPHRSSAYHLSQSNGCSVGCAVLLPDSEAPGGAGGAGRGEPPLRAAPGRDGVHPRRLPAPGARLAPPTPFTQDRGRAIPLGTPPPPALLWGQLHSTVILAEPPWLLHAQCAAGHSLLAARRSSPVPQADYLGCAAIPSSSFMDREERRTKAKGMQSGDDQI